MDFTKLKRPTFAGSKLEESDAPAGMTLKAKHRRTGMLAEAKDVLKHVLKPGESFHGIMTGRYDLMHLILVILNSQPGLCEHVRIATLSFNKANLAEMTALLESRAVRRLTLLCSKFFREHQPDIYSQTRAEFQSRGNA